MSIGSLSNKISVLKIGNKRFYKGINNTKSLNKNQKYREKLAKYGQNPFAIILSCADSRVVPEIIFDTNLGNLFVIRVAGNVAGENEIGSIELALKTNNCSILLVLGHTQCFAIETVYNALKKNSRINKPPLSKVVLSLNKNEIKKNPQDFNKKYISILSEKNVLAQMKIIFKKSIIVQNYIKKNNLNFLGGIYNIFSGKIKWLGKYSEKNNLPIN